MSKPYGKPDRIVVALGGNALGNNPVEQIEAVSNTAHALLGLIEQGNEIIITHGNGPQVGMIQNAFAAAHDAIGTPEMPLPECGAMSQGYIGYHLQQGIGREMHKRYKRWHAATVVTQIECDPDDPAFKNPTKPIGPFYTEEQAKEFMAEDPSKVFVEDSGRGWRRVVASPDPKKIVEADSILNLLDNEFIVIACGGGGIPVVRDYENKGCYKGVPAVIDKDLGGELLAEDCDADVLFLLTAVEHVAINFGKPNQEELEDLTADEAERLADEGQFGKGSMEPKVRAAIKFARSRKGRTCIIGAWTRPPRPWPASPVPASTSSLYSIASLVGAGQGARKLASLHEPRGPLRLRGFFAIHLVIGTRHLGTFLSCRQLGTVLKGCP